MTPGSAGTTCLPAAEPAAWCCCSTDASSDVSLGHGWADAASVATCCQLFSGVIRSAVRVQLVGVNPADRVPGPLPALAGRGGVHQHGRRAAAVDPVPVPRVADGAGPGRAPRHGGRDRPSKWWDSTTCGTRERPGWCPAACRSTTCSGRWATRGRRSPWTCSRTSRTTGTCAGRSLTIR